MSHIKTHMIAVRLTQSEKRMLKNYSELHNISLSEAIRKLIKDEIEYLK